MTTYCLASADFVYAPNLVRFAINGAKFKKDRPAMVKLVAKGWNIPVSAALALVKEKVPYTIVGETVVFTVETLQ